LNKICRGAFIYGLRDRLFNLLQQLFQRQIQMGKIKADGIKHVQNVINHMNRLSSSDRFIKYEEPST
jgi:flagellar motor switch protein FliG